MRSSARAAMACRAMRALSASLCASSCCVAPSCRSSAPSVVVAATFTVCASAASARCCAASSVTCAVAVWAARWAATALPLTSAMRAPRWPDGNAYEEWRTSVQTLVSWKQRSGMGLGAVVLAKVRRYAVGSMVTRIASSGSGKGRAAVCTDAVGDYCTGKRLSHPAPTLQQRPVCVQLLPCGRQHPARRLLLPAGHVPSQRLQRLTQLQVQSAQRVDLGLEGCKCAWLCAKRFKVAFSLRGQLQEQTSRAACGPVRHCLHDSSH